MIGEERVGLAVSVAAHLLLFAILSLGLMLRVVHPPLPKESMEVELTGPIPEPLVEHPLAAVEDRAVMGLV